MIVGCDIPFEQIGSTCRLLAYMYIPCMCIRVHVNASGGIDKSDNFSLLSCVSCFAFECFQRVE